MPLAISADTDGDDSEMSMRIQTAGEGGVEVGKLIGWIDWAGRHPGIVLLGALVTVILSAQMSPTGAETESAACNDEVPLFI